MKFSLSNWLRILIPTNKSFNEFALFVYITHICLFICIKKSLLMDTTNLKIYFKRLDRYVLFIEIESVLLLFLGE